MWGVGWSAFPRSLNSSVLDSLLPLGQQAGASLLTADYLHPVQTAIFPSNHVEKEKWSIASHRLCFFPCCSVSVHAQAFQFHEAALHESWNVIASSWVKWTISVPTMFLKNKITAFILLHVFSASESLCWCKGIKYSKTPARPILYNSISVEKITFIIFVRGRNKT